MLTLEQAETRLSSKNGYVEGSNNSTMFGGWYGLQNQPWCAMYLSWGCYDEVAKQSPCPATISKGYASCAAGKQWFQKNGLWGQTPKRGAHGMLYYESLRRVGHVFFIVEVDGPWVLTWEGNTDVAGGRTGGRVMQKRRRISDIDGFGYPRYRDSSQPPITPPVVVPLPVEEDGMYIKLKGSTTGAVWQVVGGQLFHVHYVAWGAMPDPKPIVHEREADDPLWKFPRTYSPYDGFDLR